MPSKKPHEDDEKPYLEWRKELDKNWGEKKPRGYRREWHTPKNPYAYQHLSTPYYGKRRPRWEDDEPPRWHKHPKPEPTPKNYFREAICALAAIQILVLTYLVL